MGWEREYEHFRDMGHTWGPGIDDVIELTEEETQIQEAEYQTFLQKLEKYRVPPREKYKIAGENLAKTLPSHRDIIYGKAPMGWREKHSKAKLDLCKQAAEDLGYSLKRAEEGCKKDGFFMIKVEQYGFLEGGGGNLHPFHAGGIKTLEDCLQLVSDFKAIGMDPTTYFGRDFHYHCSDTGRLRYELESWGKRNNIPLPVRKPALDKAIQRATGRWKDGSKPSLPEKER